MSFMPCTKGHQVMSHARGLLFFLARDCHSDLRIHLQPWNTSCVFVVVCMYVYIWVCVQVHMHTEVDFRGLSWMPCIYIFSCLKPELADSLSLPSHLALGNLSVPNTHLIFPRWAYR